MTKTATAVGLVIGLIFLAGCSVSVDAPTPPAGAPAPSAPASNGAPSDSGSQAAPTAPVTQPTSTSTYPADGSARRSAHADDVEQTIGCPTGEIVLDQGFTTTRITEPCRKLTIAANYVTVLAEHVDSLILLESSGSSTVLVRSADSVVISSDFNEVYWDQGTPTTVRVTGANNIANPNPAPEP